MTRHAGDVATEPSPAVVFAAGTVLWRPAGTTSPAGAVEIAVAHRPHRQDWSLPKGKLECGETPAACAVRETEEETGYRPVLGRPLGGVRYPVPGRMPGTKLVTYFAGRAGRGGFRPGDEVDELRWLAPAAARELLTYPTDREVLARFTAVPPDSRLLLLVRHGKAGKQGHWPGPDHLRPLSAAGREQTAALRELLPLFGPTAVHSADRVRCLDTVSGLATDLGLSVVVEPLLDEESYQADPVATRDRVSEIVAAGGTPVICSQGGVIPDLVSTLAEKSGLRPGPVRAKKGSVWALTFSAANPPRLLAAHYLPSPLPAPLPARG